MFAVGLSIALSLIGLSQLSGTNSAKIIETAHAVVNCNDAGCNGGDDKCATFYDENGKITQTCWTHC